MAETRSDHTHTHTRTCSVNGGARGAVGSGASHEWAKTNENEHAMLFGPSRPAHAWETLTTPMADFQAHRGAPGLQGYRAGPVHPPSPINGINGGRPVPIKPQAIVSSPMYCKLCYGCLMPTETSAASPPCHCHCHCHRQSLPGRHRRTAHCMTVP